MRELERAKLTDEQRDLFLTATRDGLGRRDALRKAGITGGSTALTVTRTQAKTIIESDADLHHDYLIAKGRNPDVPRSNLWRIMNDPNHPRWWDATKFHLERADADYRTAGAVDVNHTGEVKFVVESAFPDVIEGEATEEDDDDGSADPSAISS